MPLLKKVPRTLSFQKKRKRAEFSFCPVISSLSLCDPAPLARACSDLAVLYALILSFFSPFVKIFVFKGASQKTKGTLKKSP